MAVPRKYSPELKGAVVQRVVDTRAVKAHGAVKSVAQQMGLAPRLVQKWVTKAGTPASRQPPRPAAGAQESYLPSGLVYCGFCHQHLSQAEHPDPGQAYLYCRPGCRPRPLVAVAVADTVGRAILRLASKIVPAGGTPTPPHLAAIHADRVLAHITVGATPTAVSLTWRATPLSAPGVEAERAHCLATARDICLSDPLRARHLLHRSLAGVDPATASNPLYAEAATLLTELQLRFGFTDAVAWATYAHHSTAHVYGPAHPRALHALYLHATAQRQAGHHQRAYHLYRQLADHLSHAEGSLAHRTLATHATIALVLHALGHCQAARNLLARTITTHRREHPDHPATARMTQHLSRIWGDCDTKGHRHAAPDDLLVSGKRPAP